MKLQAIPFLFALATIQLRAAGDAIPNDGEWSKAALRAQNQYRQQRFAEAEQSSRAALQIAGQFGDTDTRFAMTYYQLGNIYRDWGHCADARSSYSRSIASWEKQPKAERRYVLNSMLGLLGALCECDQFNAAEKVFRKYESTMQRYQTSPAEEAAVLSVRAAIARGHQKYAKAEADYRRALDLVQHDPNSTPLEVEEERSNLGSIIAKQGRHAEALALFQQVITFFDRGNAGRPISHLAALNNVACSLAEVGRKEEAERTFERTLDFARESFGEESPLTAKVMLNYAHVLRENKELPAAEAMQKKGSETLRHAFVRDRATIDIRELR